MKRFLLFAAIAVLALAVVSCPDGNNDDIYLGDTGNYHAPPPVVTPPPDSRVFVITSPYGGIDWETIGRYRAAMHTHSTNSDGSLSLPDAIQRHYDLGFDIMAITDHVWRRLAGRVSGQECFRDLLTTWPTQTEWPGWNNPEHASFPTTPPPDMVPLTHISQAVKDAIQAGTHPVSPNAHGLNFLPRDGRGMIFIPGTAELAPGSGGPNEEAAEANVFFWGYDMGTNNFRYDFVLPANASRRPPPAWISPWNTVRAGIQTAHDIGALAIIVHPGRTTGGAAYDLGAIHSPTNPSNMPRWINHYTEMYLDFPITTLVGMEIFNRRDGDSRHDRVLWDQVLTRTVPTGRFIWGFANDDSHSDGPTGSSSIGTNVNVFLMPENTLENIHSTMIGGNFYMQTHIARNEGIDVGGSHPFGGHLNNANLPSIVSITVAQSPYYTITVVAENAERIDWITGGGQGYAGRTIMTVTGGPGSSTRDGTRVTSTLPLTHDFIDFQVGVYVRANIIGINNHGIALTQPIGTRRN